jgi:Phosphate transport regulator (distant homolog of PhoU)
MKTFSDYICKLSVGRWVNMLGIPSNDEIFFDLISKGAELSSVSTMELRKLIDEPCNPEQRLERLSKYKEEADSIFWAIKEYQSKSFITPFHTEDILIVVKELKDLTNNIVETAFELSTYNITLATSEAVELVEKLLKAAQLIAAMFGSLKNHVDRRVFLNSVTEVDNIVGEAALSYRSTVKTLFEVSSDVLTVMEWKSVYDYLQASFDSCGQLMRDLREIITKYD